MAVSETVSKLSFPFPKYTCFFIMSWWEKIKIAECSKLPKWYSTFISKCLFLKMYAEHIKNFYSIRNLYIDKTTIVILKCYISFIFPSRVKQPLTMWRRPFFLAKVILWFVRVVNSFSQGIKPVTVIPFPSANDLVLTNEIWGEFCWRVSG